MWRLDLKKKIGTSSMPEDRVVEFKRMFLKVDRMLDRAELGPVWLKQPEIAGLLEHALLIRYAEMYSLWAYAIMANHIHVLLKPKGDTTLSSIMQRLKGYTAREANRILRRTGQSFWQDESFDHWVRNRTEFRRIVAYIEDNPVKAGLVKMAEEWRWSSTSERRKRGWSRLKSFT